jgi:hypothetical protein
MDRLDHHFGEDASLEPATLTRLRAYLMENAAEYFDTLAANRLRITDPTEPLRITATPFWRRAHSAIPDRVSPTSRSAVGPLAAPAMVTRRLAYSRRNPSSFPRR